MRRGRVEQHRVADRPGSPASSGAPPRRCAAASPPRRSAGRRRRDAERRRVEHVGAHRAVGDQPDPATSSWWSARRARRRPGRPARESPRAASTCGHHRRHAAGRSTPIAAAAGRAGLVSGPRKLKNGRHAHLPPRRAGDAACRGGTPARSRSRSRPRRRSAATAGGRQVDGHARAPPARRPCRRRDEAARLPCLTTVRPAAGGDQRGHRGDVHRVRPVAAGADHVHRPAAAPCTGTARRQHAATRPGQLVRRLPLGAQQHRERGQLGRGGLAGHDLVHGPAVGSPPRSGPAHQRGRAAPASCAAQSSVTSAAAVSG